MKNSTYKPKNIKLHGQDDMKFNIFKRKSKYKDPRLEAAIKFMDDKTLQCAKDSPNMNQRQRIEFDLIREIMEVIRK